MFRDLYNNLSKWEKAGLIIGGIECVVGFTVAMYAHVECKKALKEIEQINNDTTNTMDYLDELLGRED